MLTVPLPPPFAQSRLTAPETLAEMDRLLAAHRLPLGGLSYSN